MTNDFDTKRYGEIRDGWRAAAVALPLAAQQTFMDAFFSGATVRAARDKADISFEAAMGLVTMVELAGAPDQLQRKPPPPERSDTHGQPGPD